MQKKKWARLLAYVTGLVNRQLLQNEYLAAENRILRSHLPACLRLSDPERSTLAEIGERPGRRGLERVAGVAQPDTILAWYRRLIARKFDGSPRRSYPGRPPIEGETEALIVRMARENSGWGYDRIVGALANLGHRVSDQTVANVLRRYGIAPAPKRCQKTTWKEFNSAHLAVLAGTDFFTVEVLTWRGLATYYVLFFLQLETRRVSLAEITRHPTAKAPQYCRIGRFSCQSPPGLGMIHNLEQGGNHKVFTVFLAALMAGFLWEDWTRMESPAGEIVAGHSGQRALTCRSPVLILNRKSLGCAYSALPSCSLRPFGAMSGTEAGGPLTVQLFHTSHM